MPTQKDIKLDIFDQQLNKVGDKELNPAIFGLKINQALVHQAVVAQMANSRQVLAHAKTRGEVRGGGKKPWRQKGTGRARVGSNRSPLWVGGGVTFGPSKYRNFSKKINKQMRRKAVFMCLTDKVNDHQLVLLDKFENQTAKTKVMYSFFKDLMNKGLYIDNSKKISSTQSDNKKTDKKSASTPKSVKFNLMIILDKPDKNIIKSVRNISGVKVDIASNLNVVDLLKYKYLLMLNPAIDIIEKTFVKKVSQTAKSKTDNSDKSTIKQTSKTKKITNKKV